MENSTMSMKEKVMNMMTMKMEELVAECEQAKLKFADIMLDDNADYRCKDSRSNINILQRQSLSF